MIVVFWDGRPYCAFDPVRPRPALSILPRHTFKKRLMFIYSALTAVHSRVLRLAGLPSTDDFLVTEGLSISQVMNAVASTLGVEVIPILVLWCRDLQRQRVYAWVGGESGGRWFLKIGVGARNGELLAAEALGYSTMSGSKPGAVKATLVEVVREIYVLITPWFSGSVQLRKWEEVLGVLECARAKSCRVVAFDSLAAFSWFHGTVVKSGSKLGGEVSSILSGQQLRVCFTHGDLGSENVITMANDQIQLIDLERSCSDGPFYADQVAMMLDVRLRRPLEDVIPEILRLATFEEIVFSLVFLAENQFPPALLVLRGVLERKP